MATGRKGNCCEWFLPSQQEHCVCRWPSPELLHITLVTVAVGDRKGSSATITTQSPAEPLPSVSFHKLTICLKLKQQQHYIPSCCTNSPCWQALCTSTWCCGVVGRWHKPAALMWQQPSLWTAANIPNSLQNMDAKNACLLGRCGDVHLHKDIKDKKKTGYVKRAGWKLNAVLREQHVITISRHDAIHINFPPSF